MESGKQGGSETSSEDDMCTTRSYECTFCKRGFTNAQALGGHMNIHRKDRAKAKQLKTPSLPDKSNDDYTPSTQVSCEASKYSPVLEPQKNSRVYFQPSSASDPRLPRANFQEFLGANLRLQIGPMQVEDDGMERGVNKGEEVDLELRLGHDPY